jgi:Transglycosylase-like domain
MPGFLSNLRARLGRPAVVVAFAVVVTTACFPKGSPPGAVSPHHDDPFLTCVRQRESGNRYTVDSPDGLYHGAYQFLQSTWDGTARHIGRFDLVGVDPHTANAFTQDEMAWALYQWQGKSPWAAVNC